MTPPHGAGRPGAAPRSPRPGEDRTPTPPAAPLPLVKRTCSPAPGQTLRQRRAGEAGWLGPRGTVTFPSPAILPTPLAQPQSSRRAPLPPRNLKGSVSGTTTKWLSLPGRLRSLPIGSSPPPPLPPLAVARRPSATIGSSCCRSSAGP